MEKIGVFQKYKYFAFNFGRRLFTHGSCIWRLKLKFVKQFIHIEPWGGGQNVISSWSFDKIVRKYPFIQENS